MVVMLLELSQKLCSHHLIIWHIETNRKVSNIRCTLVGNKIVDHSDVVGAAPKQRLSALLQLHLHSQLNTWLQLIGQRQQQGETSNIYVLGLDAFYIRVNKMAGIWEMAFQKIC